VVHLQLAAGPHEILAWDSLSSIATAGVFVPAMVLVGLVVGAVVRDRRLSAREREQAGSVDSEADDEASRPSAD
jgi:hypothetical protein